ncbi:hypothetical protein EV426DRAFT_578608 [Tirmania nivea]|nr:hypothetical protein EV426DRAFT_578608 [Tirmania nivea]
MDSRSNFRDSSTISYLSSQRSIEEVDTIYKDIKENKKITVLQWFFNNYSKDRSFWRWKNKPHFEYLNYKVQVDKVAYFYCKRDEADRRERDKILLSLIKQFAYPPPTDSIETASHARICEHALEANNKEQKDASARRQLNFDSSLNLWVN